MEEKRKKRELLYIWVDQPKAEGDCGRRKILETRTLAPIVGQSAAMDETAVTAKSDWLSNHTKAVGERTEDVVGGVDDETWDTLSRSFGRRRSNHESKIPDNLVKNVGLITQIHGNISKVGSIYSNLSVNFSTIVHHRRVAAVNHRNHDGDRREDEDKAENSEDDSTEHVPEKPEMVELMVAGMHRTLSAHRYEVVLEFTGKCGYGGHGIRNRQVDMDQGMLHREESSASNVTSRDSVFAYPKLHEIKVDASSMAIENWLKVDNTSRVLFNALSPNSGTVYGGTYSTFRRAISKFGRGKYTFGRLASSSEDHGKQCSENSEIDSENTCIRSTFDNNAMGEDFPIESDGLRFLPLPDWPQITYGVVHKIYLWI
ncbi:Protein ELF4-LIKE 1, partial [Mucuna pruriens]